MTQSVASLACAFQGPSFASGAAALGGSHGVPRWTVGKLARGTSVDPGVLPLVITAASWCAKSESDILGSLVRLLVTTVPAMTP